MDLSASRVAAGADALALGACVSVVAEGAALAGGAVDALTGSSFTSTVGGSAVGEPVAVGGARGAGGADGAAVT
jgi:hypothetical protein